MDFDFEFPPGDTTLRPQMVLAAAPRTEQMREDERALELYTLVAVQRDALVPVTCEALLRDAPRQLGIPEHELAVEGLSEATFLLRFSSPAARNVALSTRAFQVGNCVLNIMTWSRRIGASVGKLKYRARVCLEGVPRHARNTAAVAQLFTNPSFVDEIDYNVEEEVEKFCFNVWVWTDAPSDLALQGTLQIEEPADLPDDYYTSMDTTELSLVRDRPAKTFDYTVLIHLDRVLDYTPPSNSSGRHSFESDISGIPRDDPYVPEYPAKFDYKWYLGFRDGDRPRRASVHDRLGARRARPDRSPPRGGNGGGGLGLRQVPSVSRNVVARMNVNRQWSSSAGSSGYGGRRHVAEHAAGESRQEWRPKQKQQHGGMVSEPFPQTTDGSVLFREREALMQRSVDPMEEEAARTSRPAPHKSARPQRSVEPTATKVDWVRSELSVGAHGPVGFPSEERAHATVEEHGDPNLQKQLRQVENQEEHVHESLFEDTVQNVFQKKIRCRSKLKRWSTAWLLLSWKLWERFGWDYRVLQLNFGRRGMRVWMGTVLRARVYRSSQRMRVQELKIQPYSCSKHSAWRASRCRRSQSMRSQDTMHAWVKFLGLNSGGKLWPAGMSNVCRRSSKEAGSCRKQ
ncbi:unnamed protein product [Urochloa humidicola]